jgi:hypothetical protein
MIDEAAVERCLSWLSRNAVPAAKARAERIYMEAWIKTVLAQEMRAHAELPVAAQEREARVSKPYLDALDALRAAVELDEKARYLRDAAGAKIEAWRTMESTRRAEGRATQ